ncbi:putative HTH-type transcriptional regulator [Streptomyces sp. enrichment culture]|uniref:TetR/AcrR family transcriptional regulator n=1 Tax=Streptomyces sp. enrichment culture TaxID=1795815 RepID=UPI003F557F61
MATDPAPPAPARRAPAGAAVLREDVTAAIREAVLAELAAAGFARMSIEGVARRAGVGKTAVYRRWKSKLPLVLDLIGAFAADGLPAPSTGSLHGDVRALLEVFANLLRHPVASAVIPDLLVEAARHPELADAVRGALLEGRRRMAQAVVAAAQERGELPAGVDPAAAMDLVAGPLYWRQTVIGQPLDGPELDVLARQVVAGLKAAPAAG